MNHNSFFLIFQQILSIATNIAKNTSVLCNAAREASSNTTNPIARRRFVESTKNVANGTAELVRTIKVCFHSRPTIHFKYEINFSRY